MAKKKKVGSTGRFSSRYGVKIRRSIKEIEKNQKKYYDCPRCHHKKVKRESSGIWNCKKCDLTFAGGAYKPHLGRRIKRIEEEE